VSEHGGEQGAGDRSPHAHRATPASRSCPTPCAARCGRRSSPPRPTPVPTRASGHERVIVGRLGRPRGRARGPARVGAVVAGSQVRAWRGGELRVGVAAAPSRPTPPVAARHPPQRHVQAPPHGHQRGVRAPGHHGRPVRRVRPGRRWGRRGRWRRRRRRVSVREIGEREDTGERRRGSRVGLSRPSPLLPSPPPQLHPRRPQAVGRGGRPPGLRIHGRGRRRGAPAPRARPGPHAPQLDARGRSTGRRGARARAVAGARSGAGEERRRGGGGAGAGCGDRRRRRTPAFRVEGTVVSTRILQALWARLFGRAHQIRNLLESRCDKKLVAVAMSTKKPCDKWLVFHPKLGMHRAQCRTATAPQTQPLHDARAHGQVAPPPARRALSKTMASPTRA